MIKNKSFDGYDDNLSVRIWSTNSKLGNGNHEGDFVFPAYKVLRILLVYDGYRERLILKNEEK